MAANRMETAGALMGWIDAACEADRILVLGVCGLPSAGKTTLCRALEAQSPGRIFRFDCDSFSAFSYHERVARIERAATSGDASRLAVEENPRHWYDWQAIGEGLCSLRTTRQWSYDRAWNNRSGELDAAWRLELPASGPAVVLCDCIYLLHPPVRHWLDFCVLVEAPPKERLARGVARDPERAADMERLNITYAAPYFASWGAQADALYAPDMKTAP